MATQSTHVSPPKRPSVTREEPPMPPSTARRVVPLHDTLPPSEDVVERHDTIPAPTWFGDPNDPAEQR